MISNQLDEPNYVMWLEYEKMFYLAPTKPRKWDISFNPTLNNSTAPAEPRVTFILNLQWNQHQITSTCIFTDIPHCFNTLYSCWVHLCNLLLPWLHPSTNSKEYEIVPLTFLQTTHSFTIPYWQSPEKTKGNHCFHLGFRYFLAVTGH